MPLGVSIYTFLSFSAAAFAAALALLAWWRRPAAGSAVLALLSSAGFFWAFGFAMRVLSPDVGAKILWTKVVNLGAVPAATLWLLLVLRCTGAARGGSKWVFGWLAIEPVATLGAAWAVPRGELFAYGHHLVEQEGWRFMVASTGPWFWAHYAYAYAAVIVGAGVLIYELFGHRKRHRVARSLLIALPGPWVAALGYLIFELTGIQPFGLPLDYTPIGFAIGCVPVAWAVLRRDLLGLGPTARQALFDLMSDPVLVLDGERRVVDANDAAIAVLGEARSDLLGGRAEAALLAGRQGAPDWSRSASQIEITRTVDGEPKQIDFRIQRLAETADGGGGWLLVGRDISRDRAAERRLQHQHKLESLGRMAGGMAHDFNNLLTSVLGNLELNLMGAAGREAVIEAKHAAEQATEVSRQLLVYSGRAQLTSEKVAVAELVQDAASLVESGFSGRLRIRLDHGAGSMTVQGDRAQLQQAIVNLMTNGLEALGERGGTTQILVRQRRVGAEEIARSAVASESEPGEYVVASFVDHGTGIGPEDLPRIFDPFFSTKFVGRGLGLATAQSVVRSHGGDLLVESTLGEGSEFKILLPAAGRRPDAKSVAAEAAEWFAGETVLLVDDEPEVRAIGRRMLEQLGLTVREAKDGAQAIELLRRHHEAIDIVVMDLTMPGLDGAETLKRLQQIQSDVRCILTTGYDPEDTIGRHHELDISGVLAKPYTLAALRDRLGAGLRGRSSPEVREAGRPEPAPGRGAEDG